MASNDLSKLYSANMIVPAASVFKTLSDPPPNVFQAICAFEPDGALREMSGTTLIPARDYEVTLNPFGGPGVSGIIVMGGDTLPPIADPDTFRALEAPMITSLIRF